MAAYKKRPDFITSEEGIRVEAILNLMVLDDTYVTRPSFSADTEKYSNNLIPFIDKHMAYLRDHPSTNPNHYISNLKLMTRLRR